MIEARGLVKRYGRRLALGGVSLDAAPGDVVGLVGPNGAGKTTCLRVLASLLRPDAGSARVAGLDVVRDAEAVRGRIGYMPERFGLYDELTLEQYLDFFARVYGLVGAARRRHVEAALDLVDLLPKRHDRCEGLSKGARQRLFLSRTLLHDPDVLLLDEPASGLDPQARLDLRALLQDLAGRGKTVLLSSHVLSELEQVCSRVVVVEAGRVAFAGSLDDMRDALGGERRVRIRFVDDASAALAVSILEGLPEAPDRSLGPLDQEGSVVALPVTASPEAVADLHRALVTGGARVFTFEVEAPTLEALFLDLTRGEVV